VEEHKRRKSKVVTLVIFVAGIIFVGVLAVRSWREIVHTLEEIKWYMFVLSTLIAVLGNVVTSILFRDLLKKYGLIVSNTLASRLFFYGQIAKYIPGKIWSLIYQITSLRREGATTAILFSNIELVVVMILVNGTIALCLILFNIHLIFAITVFLLALLSCLFIGRSYVIFQISRKLLYLVGSRSTALSTYVSRSGNWRIVIYFTSIWLFYLGSTFLMMYAVFDLPIQDSWRYIVYLNLAWIGGVLAFIAAAGLGVREIMFVLVTGYSSGNVSLNVVATIAVLTRFWQILEDLCGVVITLLYNIRVRKI